MEFDDYFFLGRLLKPHGFDGRMNAFLDVDDPTEYEDLKMVFIQMNNNLVPYFIDHIQFLNKKAIITFQDIDNLEKAELLMQKELFLPLSELPERTGNKFYFHEIIGFSVIDKEFGPIGTVSKVLEYPNQAVMQIFHNKKEVLIPISDEIIKEVKRDNKEIHITSPDGLLEIYIGK
jgi:16S rRNA processing protein RimM